MNPSVDILNLSGIVAEFPQNGAPGHLQSRTESVFGNEFAPLLDRNLNQQVDKSFYFNVDPGLNVGAFGKTGFLNLIKSEILEAGAGKDQAAKADADTEKNTSFNIGGVLSEDILVSNINLDNKNYPVGCLDRPDDNQPPCGRGPQDKIIINYTNQNKAALRPLNQISNHAPLELSGLAGSFAGALDYENEIQDINLSNRSLQLNTDSFLQRMAISGKSDGDNIGLHQAAQLNDLNVLSKETGEIGQVESLKTIKPAAEYFDKNVFREINVRQIKIEQETTQKAILDESPKSLFINGVNGQQSSLKSELTSGEKLVDGKPLLSANQYNQFQNSEITGSHTLSNSNSDVSEFENVQGNTGRNPQNNGNSGDSKYHEGAASKDLSGIFMNIELDSAGNAGKVGSATMIETTGNNVETKPGDITPVRFVLPANINHDNASIRKTIYIKMIPEHLGTIRLTLSSLNDVITGRMIVDNSSAVTALESHIDTLLNDLADKGVKIDAFQIALAGGQTGQNSSRGRLTSVPKRNNGWSGNKAVNTGNNLPAQGLTANSVQYVGAAGVNLLA